MFVGPMMFFFNPFFRLPGCTTADDASRRACSHVLLNDSFRKNDEANRRRFCAAFLSLSLSLSLSAMGSMMNDDDGAFLKKVGTHERDERKQFFFLLVFFFEKNENFRRERRPSPLSCHMNNGMNHVFRTSHTLSLTST